MAPSPQLGAVLCSPGYHDSLRASEKAFRAGVRMTFSALGVNEAGKDASYQYGNCTRCHSTIGIPSAMLDRRSTVYEHEARREKVATIVAMVPAGATREENARLAAQLEAYDDGDRRAFAKAAGAKRKPSPETWRLVCVAVRTRKTAQEIEAEDAAAGAVIS